MPKEVTPKQEKKQPYEKPAIVHSQVLESIAGACNEPDPINGKTGVGDLCTVIAS